VSYLWDSAGFSLAVPLKKIYLPLALFVIFSACSYFFSMDKFCSRNELFNLLNWIFLFYVSAEIMKEYSRKLIIFFQLISIIGGSLAVIGIWQFLTGQTVAGTMVNPNIFAGYLVMIVPCLLWLVINDGNSKTKGIAYILLLIIITACLVLTGSLAGLAGVFCGVFILMYLLPGRELLKKYKYAFFLIACILIIIAVSRIDNDSFINRLFWWKTALKMMAAHPLTGIGIGCFGSAYECFKSGGLSTLYAHNYFLQTGAETGIIGMAALIWFLIEALKKKSAVNIPLFSGVCAVLIQNLFDYNLCIPANAVLFWVMLGMMQKEESAQGNVLTHDKSKKWMLTVVSSAIVAVMLVAVIKPFIANRDWVMGNIRLEQASTCGLNTKSGMEALKGAEGYYIEAIKSDPLNSMHYSGLSDVYINYYLADGYKSWLDEAQIEMNKAAGYRNCSQFLQKKLLLLKNLRNTEKCTSVRLKY